MRYHDCVYGGGSRVKDVREGIRFEVFCMGGRYAIWERISVVALSLTRLFSCLYHRDRRLLIASCLKHGAEHSQISSLAYFAVVMHGMWPLLASLSEHFADQHTALDQGLGPHMWDVPIIIFLDPGFVRVMTPTHSSKCNMAELF